MKVRIEVGTDIAAIGVWDANNRARTEGQLSPTALEAAARNANLFLVRTGGDGGGPADVFVDEAIPESARNGLRALGGEHLLHLPSGRVVVSGAEDFGAAGSATVSPGNFITIPPGDYAVRCFASPDEETGTTPPTESEKRAALGEPDYRYFRRVERLSLLGYLTLLLFPALSPVVGWKWSAAITLVVLAAYFWVQEEWLLKRNARYQAARRRINELWKGAHAKSAPTLLFELRRTTDTAGLTGGSVRLRGSD